MRTFFDFNESLKTLNCAEYSGDAVKSFGRDTRIVRVAGQANLEFFRNRDNALKKMRDVFPYFLGRDLTCPRSDIRIGVLQSPCAITRAATSWCRRGAEYSQQGQVVLNGWNAGRRTLSNNLTRLVNFLLAVGLSAQHDCLTFTSINMR